MLDFAWLLGLGGVGLLVFAVRKGRKQASRYDAVPDPAALRTLARFALQPSGPCETVRAAGAAELEEELTLGFEAPLLFAPVLHPKQPGTIEGGARLREVGAALRSRGPVRWLKSCAPDGAPATPLVQA